MGNRQETRSDEPRAEEQRSMRSSGGSGNHTQKGRSRWLKDLWLKELFFRALSPACAFASSRLWVDLRLLAALSLTTLVAIALGPLASAKLDPLRYVKRAHRYARPNVMIFLDTSSSMGRCMDNDTYLGSDCYRPTLDAHKVVQQDTDLVMPLCTSSTSLGASRLAVAKRALSHLIDDYGTAIDFGLYTFRQRHQSRPQADAVPESGGPSYANRGYWPGYFLNTTGGTATYAYLLDFAELYEKTGGTWTPASALPSSFVYEQRTYNLVNAQVFYYRPDYAGTEWRAVHALSTYPASWFDFDSLLALFSNYTWRFRAAHYTVLTYNAYATPIDPSNAVHLQGSVLGSTYDGNGPPFIGSTGPIFRANATAANSVEGGYPGSRYLLYPYGPCFGASSSDCSSSACQTGCNGACAGACGPACACEVNFATSLLRLDPSSNNTAGMALIPIPPDPNGPDGLAEEPRLRAHRRIQQWLRPAYNGGLVATGSRPTAAALKNPRSPTQYAYLTWDDPRAHATPLSTEPLTSVTLTNEGICSSGSCSGHATLTRQYYLFRKLISVANIKQCVVPASWVWTGTKANNAFASLGCDTASGTWRYQGSFYTYGGSYDDDDLYTLFNNDIIPADPRNAAGCRADFILLITDGAPDDPYTGDPTAVQAATDLASIGVKTVVVALGKGGQDAKSTLDAISQAGSGVDALPAYSEKSLEKALRQTFLSMVRSGDFPLGQPTTATYEDGSGKPGNIALQATTEFPVWRGHLRAYDIATPDNNNPTATQLFDAGEVMRTTWQSRKLYTSDSSKALVAIEDSDDSASTLYNTFHLGNSQAEARAIIKWLRGARDPNDPNDAWLLGPLVNSAPAVVGVPPLRVAPEDYPESYLYYDDSPSAFRRTFSERPTLIYAGGADGMLHAFHVNAGPTWAAGREAFAYVPPTLIPNLAKLYMLGGQPSDFSKFSHFVAASPKVSDVNTCSGAPTAATCWKTILVMGLGPGRGSKADSSLNPGQVDSTYFALDISDPTDLSSLWPTSGSSMAPFQVLWNHELSAQSYKDWNGESWSVPAFTRLIDTGQPVDRLFSGSGFAIDTSANQGRYDTLVSLDTGTSTQQCLPAAPENEPGTPNPLSLSQLKQVPWGYGMVADLVSPLIEVGGTAAGAWQADMWGQIILYPTPTAATFPSPERILRLDGTTFASDYWGHSLGIMPDPYCNPIYYGPAVYVRVDDDPSNPYKGAFLATATLSYDEDEVINDPTQGRPAGYEGEFETVLAFSYGYGAAQKKSAFRLTDARFIQPVADPNNAHGWYDIICPGGGQPCYHRYGYTTSARVVASPLIIGSSGDDRDVAIVVYDEKRGNPADPNNPGSPVCGRGGSFLNVLRVATDDPSFYTNCTRADCSSILTGKYLQTGKSAGATVGYGGTRLVVSMPGAGTTAATMLSFGQGTPTGGGATNIRAITEVGWRELY